MLRQNLINRVASHYHNNTMAFLAFNLFLVTTEGRVVTEDDFDPWFYDQVQRFGLIEGKHFYPSGTGTKIRGNAALIILAQQDNVIGACVREHLRRFDIDNDELIRMINS